MKITTLVLLAPLTFLNSCTLFSPHKLTCLVGGYDSIIYYTGTSDHMQDINHGHVTDSLFMDSMFRKVNDLNLDLTVKPGGGAGVGTDIAQIKWLALTHNVSNRSLEVIDDREQKAFGFSTPPIIKDAIEHPDKPLQLTMPDETASKPDSLSDFRKAHTLTILLADSIHLYAYWGDRVEDGQKYTLPQLTDTLNAKSSDSAFVVEIKPTANSTYEATVAILDEMTRAHVSKYAMVTLRPDEQLFCDRLRW